ncbi:MAG: SLAC1 anion channel family protein [Campylobacterales bacterium]
MVQQLPMRLSNFPVMFFAVVMGFGGLSLAWLKAHEHLGVALWPGALLSWATLALFALIGLLYLLKGIRHKETIVHEFGHPVRINFFAAISISLLILSMLPPARTPGIDAALWWTGLIAQSFLTLYVIRFWIERSLETHHSSPAWFIPVVGNLIVPVSGVEYAPFEVLFFYFSAGLFFWFVLFAVLAYRLIFHPQMAQKFMPTLFIFIAPPAIGFLDYLKLFGGLDYGALALYNLTIFFVLLLAFMGRRFIGLPFFISWWAFTFPLAAATLATLTLFEKLHTPLLEGLSWLFLAATSAMVAVVSYQTLKAVSRREICIQE